MTRDPSLDDLLQKVWNGHRIDQTEAARLYPLPLEELGALADRRRQLVRGAAHGGRGNDIVTYQVDRNVNYTNVCNVYCKFCAFYRTEKDGDAYVITLDEMDRKIEETLRMGGTQILLQGGHHPKLTKQWYSTCSPISKHDSPRSIFTDSARVNSFIFALCSTNPCKKSSPISKPPGSGPSPAEAGRSWWIACGGGFLH